MKMALLLLSVFFVDEDSSCYLPSLGATHDRARGAWVLVTAVVPVASGLGVSV